MTMVPANPTFSTPTVFKPAKPLERLPNEDWLQYADKVRAQHLGTSLSHGLSELLDSPACSEQASLQVDVQLLQPGTSDTEPRSVRWCQLCTEASNFRMQVDLFDNNPADGVRIDGETIYWNLSAGLPFMSYEALRGASADSIYYTAPADSDNTSQESMFAKGISPEFETDSWMQINLELQSSLQPSLQEQEHTVNSVSLGMVWKMSTKDYPPELSPSLINLVPSRMDWESSVPSGEFRTQIQNNAYTNTHTHTLVHVHTHIVTHTHTSKTQHTRVHTLSLTHTCTCTHTNHSGQHKH